MLNLADSQQDLNQQFDFYNCISTHYKSVFKKN
jgi:hypothetical protein